jgi:hypothetical protein
MTGRALEARKMAVHKTLVDRCAGREPVGAKLRFSTKDAA